MTSEVAAHAASLKDDMLATLRVKVETDTSDIAALGGRLVKAGQALQGKPATAHEFVPGLPLREVSVFPTPAKSPAGLRFDGGKVQLELIPPEWIEALGQVLTKGAAKYEPRNWEKGMAWSKMIGCAMRHLLAFMKGERFDTKPDAQGRPGTGCHHLALAAINLLMLMSYDVRRVGDNDLPRTKTGPTMASTLKKGGV
jgi:hypothetical protein